MFLYEQVPEKELGSFEGFARARRPKHLPRVLSRRQVRTLLGAMHGPNALVARLLYGAGLRLSEALRARVKDLDFEGGRLDVRTVQELLEHENLDTTMIYTHIAGRAGAESPLDSLEN